MNGRIHRHLFVRTGLLCGLAALAVLLLEAGARELSPQFGGGAALLPVWLLCVALGALLCADCARRQGTLSRGRRAALALSGLGGVAVTGGVLSLYLCH